MGNRLLIEKQGTTVIDVDGWFDAAPPKGGRSHWRDGYSAKELANAWTHGGPNVPSEITSLLDTLPATTGFVATSAEPEAVTRLDGFRGEGRNHDLVVVGEAAGHPTLLAIEGKALEPFGKRLSDEISSSLPAASKKPDRLNLLSRALFDRDAVDLATRIVDSDLGQLRYQLLTATVGAVIEARARGCTQVVLIVHEFRPRSPEPAESALLAEHHSDLQRFVDRLGADHTPGQLAGPIKLTATAYVDATVDLYIGKASRELGEAEVHVSAPVAVTDSEPEESPSEWLPPALSRTDVPTERPPQPTSGEDTRDDAAEQGADDADAAEGTCQTCGAPLGRWRRLRSQTCRACSQADDKQRQDAQQAYVDAAAALQLHAADLAERLHDLGVTRADGLIADAPLRTIHRQTVSRMVASALQDERLTQDEEDGLNQVLTSFGLTVDAIPNKQLVGMLYGRLKGGRLPVIRQSSLVTEPREVVHAEFKANLLVEETVRKSVGGGGVSVNVGLGIRLYSGSTRRTVPAGTRMRVHDRGTVVITSRRTVFIGRREHVSIPHSRIDQVRYNAGQVQLAVKNRKSIVVLGIGGARYAAELIVSARNAA